MMSPTFRPAAPPAAAAAEPPPSKPSSATPAMASMQPSQVTTGTLSPEKYTSTGVNAMDACVRKLTRVASVNSSATLHAPCAVKFQNASSAAASQNTRDLGIHPELFSPAMVWLRDRRIMGMKHMAAMMPRTAPIMPGEGGPGMLYTILKATVREPYAAATKSNNRRPCHTLGAATAAPAEEPSAETAASVASELSAADAVVMVRRRAPPVAAPAAAPEALSRPLRLRGASREAAPAARILSRGSVTRPPAGKAAEEAEMEAEAEAAEAAEAEADEASEVSEVGVRLKVAAAAAQMGWL
mmetsp:Transcript_27274/g.67004  ORF Transcript_27274/g.67004 Transcript_27274/m.67004 type:complete len:299 (-) Transcript_27274:281-1177(-)